MKKAILLVWVVLVNTLLFAQTPAEIISDIRSEFAIINANVSSYKIIEKELIDFSTEGGNVKGYYENGVMRLMVAEVYGETGQYTDSYYYKNGVLFFVFSKNTIYSAPVYLEGSEIVSIEENRYYFNNNTMIQWINPDKQKIALTNPKFSETAQQVLTEGDKLKSIVESK